MAIRVCIVEDDLEMRQMLSKIIDSTNEFSLTATFADAESFLSSFSNLIIDVVLMDIGLPGINGIQAVAKAKPIKPEVQFVMCTVLEDDDNIFNSLCVGATGYLLKNDSKLNLQNAIQEVAHGGSPMSASIARRVVQSFERKTSIVPEENNLTPRQWELLMLLDKGLPYKQIAEQLHLTVETVRSYIRDIYMQLQVHTRAEALHKIFPRNN
ncbi:MAG TPA: response regulator transcription factor [Chitinophagales bacterium]|nr:response regulator transcription factor [Chitinophagales bacterium]